MISLRVIYIEDGKIEVVKQWSEPQFVQDIQVFFGFTNFYWYFIQRFSWIAASFTSMLKTSCTELAELRKGVVGIVSSREKHGNRT